MCSASDSGLGFGRTALAEQSGRAGSASTRTNLRGWLRVRSRTATSRSLGGDDPVALLGVAEGGDGETDGVPSSDAPSVYRSSR